MSTWRPLADDELGENPFAEFRRWYDEAEPLMADRSAVALITASLTGRPSGRMVLLRHVDDERFGWYTNYDSRKGRELRENPQAALLWYCEPLGRQIRIEGRVEVMDAAASDEYFAARPRGHQVGAHASPQSSPLPSRAALEARVAAAEATFAVGAVPRPAHWGGFFLWPDTFEFWQQRTDRLHDRFVYHRESGGWTRQRLAP